MRNVSGVVASNKRRAKHGECGIVRTAEYDAWRAMKNRCYTTSNLRFHHYGGRGISVCDRWRHSFKAFLDDVGRRPTPMHSIDRIDVSGHYEPSNVRWATRKEQSNNRQDNHRYEYNGRSLTMYEWARDVGLNVGTLHHRIRAGWTITEALTTPRQQGQIRGGGCATAKRLEWNGHTYTVKQLAEAVGLPYETLRGRLKNKWPIDRAVLTSVRLQKSP